MWFVIVVIVAYVIVHVSWHWYTHLTGMDQSMWEQLEKEAKPRLYIKPQWVIDAELERPRLIEEQVYLQDIADRMNNDADYDWSDESWKLL